MNQPTLDSAVTVTALLFSGLAAGMFLMDLPGYYAVLPRMDVRAAIELHQLTLPGRRFVLQVAVGGAAAAGLGLLLAARAGLPRTLLAAHLACLVGLILYTNLAVIPLNREIATWTPAAPPPGWQEIFARMIARERLRAVVPAVAFVFQLAACLDWKH